MSTLPIDALLPDIAAALRAESNLVLVAEPGAGKTTRVPPALLTLVAGEVLVLEPRRIAARLAARRVAAELGESVGETVGYTVRFEDVSGPRTRLRFVTEGVLTRRLLSDPELRGVDAVVLDEFHERHVDTDLSLALLRRLQRGKRPELRIVVMSATLDPGPVADFLSTADERPCPVLRSGGRAYPLEVRHLGHSATPLERQVRGALELWLREGHDGGALVFLPGTAEIRRAMRACEGIGAGAGLDLLPLSGDLGPAEQDLAVSPAARGRRKVVFATNVAESSVTIEGVSCVVDSGLARVATHSPWTGLPSLAVARVSKASARQRAGRAGRTGPGVALRLYEEADFAQRPEQDTPEILRADLAQLSLTLRVLHVEHSADFWLEAPPAEAWAAADLLLDRLGATGTMTGKLARLPMPPRLGRLVVEACARGVAEQGARAAALLGSGVRLGTAGGGAVDLLAALDQPMEPRAHQQLLQIRRLTRALPQGSLRGESDEALLLAVLAGFPDRVGRARAAGLVQLVGGTSADTGGMAGVPEFVVALDVEDRSDRPLPMVRVLARCEPLWLLEMFPERVVERNDVLWNRVAERAETANSLVYDGLVLEETRGARPDAEKLAALLAGKAFEAGLQGFVDEEALAELEARAEFAGVATVGAQDVLRELCAGLTSFAELQRLAGETLLPLLESRMGAGKLRELAPTSLRLASGRMTRVHYEQGKPPWVASRLQDFFGMRETPRVGAARVPMVVHLLAPNKRAVQTTTDLAGFWERLYPSVRRELGRRYPRHDWPEKPV